VNASDHAKAMLPEASGQISSVIANISDYDVNIDDGINGSAGTGVVLAQALSFQGAPALAGLARGRVGRQPCAARGAE